MANAIVNVNSIGGSDGSLTINLDVVFTGVDVPGSPVLSQGVIVSAAASSTAAQIQSAIATAVTQRATSNGYTVASGSLTQIGWAKG